MKRLFIKLGMATLITTGVELFLWAISPTDPVLSREPINGLALGGAAFLIVWFFVIADHLGWLKDIK